MVRLASSITLMLICSAILPGQNIGIGTSDPSEKLEVSGMIYTNEGGIKFPDETVQTTAAFNMPPETYPIERGIGFGKFFNADLDGTIDSLGLVKLSLIYSFDTQLEKINGFNALGPVVIEKQTDRGSPGFFKFLVNGTQASTMEFHLTRPNASGNLEIYHRVKLTNVFVRSLTPTLRPSVNGRYVHTDRIELMYDSISFYDIPSGKCYCWNIFTNTSCGCP